MWLEMPVYSKAGATLAALLARLRSHAAPRSVFPRQCATSPLALFKELISRMTEDFERNFWAAPR